MISSLSTTNLTGRKRQRFSWLATKSANRRLSSLLSRHLPVLILWSLVVIFLLYRLLASPEAQDNSKTIKLRYEQDNELRLSKYQPLTSARINHGTNKEVEEEEPKSEPDIVSNVITKQPFQNPQLSSTTRKSTDDYSRQSKVFILIVQNEEFGRVHAAAGSISGKADKLSQNHLTIPAHIRLLISILQSHRIEYAIDVIRLGLPTALLSDQYNGKQQSGRRYSVIVIDDFVKYTRLSRWARDQLNRHCRANKIGVIAYVTSQPVDNEHLQRTHRQVSPITRSALQPTEGSLADQFPLTLRAVQKGDCNNGRLAECLVDYQLNDKSPILRILKRRTDFIVPGALEQNANGFPWISMSTNHLTYEPLTWAKLGQFKSSSVDSDEKSSMSSRNTRATDQTSSAVQLQQQLDKSTSSRQPISQYRLGELHLLNQSSNGWNLDDPLEASSEGEHDNGKFATESIDSRLVLSMYDRGLYDGIQRVIVGAANQHWLDRILILDAIEHLSSGSILTPLERFLQIDIDDIFVGEKGTRMSIADVDYLLDTQTRFASRIHGGFKFNLGYSGKYFQHGTDEENLGDRRLVEEAKHFTWFCHTWSHSKAHLMNDTEAIKLELRKNLDFAKLHSLPLIGQPEREAGQEKLTAASYAVAPHHSGGFALFCTSNEKDPTSVAEAHFNFQPFGSLKWNLNAILNTTNPQHNPNLTHLIVYPIHNQLYEAWREVLNVQVTSTEEYPHLRPSEARRAFVHQTIKVLPRQTCGLYTHTIFRRKYPGGLGKLVRSIEGGELFESVLHNPVNIYMTHMSNYAHDRLADFTFGSLLDFIANYTNLQLSYSPSKANQLGPAKLADYYFQLHPEEREPLWNNPCKDRRHLAIWAAQKRIEYCPLLPSILLVGPQKTGSTALYSYLQINPTFSSAKSSKEDFEELQFFNDKHYFEGLDWYLERFSRTNKVRDSGELIYFDKSATYFDDPKVARRAQALIPEARIVIMLIDPADRAYSWYQHMKAHNNLAATRLTFDQLMMGANSDRLLNSSLADSARQLRERCLHPGYYSTHLSRWLEFYPSRQIIIIDAQWFRLNPAAVMNKLQLLLRLRQPIDYKLHLAFSSRKGFFCQRQEQLSEQLHCLGPSKGRKYPPMSSQVRAYLNRHYWSHNRELARLLSEIGQPMPSWLDEAIGSIVGPNSAIY